jgi:polyphosphate kinase
MSDGQNTSSLYLNRELSWLAFNARVLHEAEDPRVPLLERVKFLAIFSSNLDEFFMKRMAVIRPLSEDTSVAAEERRNVISRRRETITAMLAEQAACYTEVIRPELAEHRIHLVDWGDLTVAQRDEASILFDKEISPVLTPLSLDAAHPFPYVSNLSTSWAFRLEDPVSGEEVLVRLKVPRELPQWVRVRAGVEPKLAAFREMLSQREEHEMIALVCVDWWNYWPTAYFAGPAAPSWSWTRRSPPSSVTWSSWTGRCPSTWSHRTGSSPSMLECAQTLQRRRS